MSDQWPEPIAIVAGRSAIVVHIASRWLPQLFRQTTHSNTMKSARLWRHLAIGLVAAGPVGGFFLGLLNAGDPDPNPLGRLVHAGMMAVQTPLHAGFPPNHAAGAGQHFNAWPHIAISGLLIFGWLVYRDRKPTGNSR